MVGARVWQVSDRETGVFGANSPMRRGSHAEYLVIEESGAIVRAPARTMVVDYANGWSSREKGAK